MSDKMREEFEAWCPIPPGCVFHEGKYGFWLVWDESGEPEFSTGMGFTQTKWEAWQASRSAVVIELPQIVGFEGAYDSLQDHELVPRMSDVEDADEIFGLVRSIEVREALEAVGVKCK